RWLEVADLAAAVPALGITPRRVFLTTGRLGVAAFKAAPQHRYLLRSIDPPDPADLPPLCDVVLARGPFSVADEIA
ncbi:precorrin-6A/cobalt-precorrin-6A reductase, partial [Mycobacterium tuberculosis]|nr:precorrin-6A/cobalt-precorrin-6A reductase [Mycobacterium tuberculosis]